MKNNKLAYEQVSIEIVTLLQSDIITNSSPYDFEAEDDNLEW